MNIIENLGRRTYRNLPLCDGTPRHEKGWRVFADVRVDEPFYWVGCIPVVRTTIRSPLFQTEREANEWAPSLE